MKRWLAILAGLLALGAVGLLPVRRAAGGEATVARVTAYRLGELLRALWPLRLENLADRVTGLSSWAEADRRYVWLRTLCTATGRSLAATGSTASDASGEAKEAIGTALGQAVRAAQGDDAWGGGTDDGLAPGALAWPAAGRLAEAGPASPGPGLSLETARDAPILAVARGSVVYAGRLRPWGRVVILAHGAHWHTVYACLSQVAVSRGEAVDRQGRLGTAGPCLPGGKAGVYFELRFGEKALNPAEWFAASP